MDRSGGGGLCPLVRRLRRRRLGHSRRSDGPDRADTDACYWPDARAPGVRQLREAPPGNPDPTKCQTEAPTFLGDVEDAIRTLRQEQPGLFSGDQILNVGAYYVGLVRVLDRKGLCADFDGEELGVTNTRDYSDVFDVQTARDLVRQYYVGTCYPALVPIQRGRTTPPPAGCALPSSREIACGREPEGRFHGDVTAASKGSS